MSETCCIQKGELRPLYLLVTHFEKQEEETLGELDGKREDWEEECVSGIS